MEFSQNFMILRFKKKIIFTIHYIAHIFTFKIPYYGLYRFIKVFGDNVWYRFPIKDFIIPKAMPDGNRIILRWRGTMEQRGVSIINHYMIDSLNPRVTI